MTIYDRRLETLSQTSFEIGFSNSIYLRHEFFSHFSHHKIHNIHNIQRWMFPT